MSTPENSRMSSSHEWLEGLAEGDDAAIWQLTTERHPAYHLGTS